MNFEFSEEQQMVRDSIARFVQDDYDWDTRRAIVASDSGMSDKAWQTFAELGWLSIPFAEEDGGFGGNIVDTMVIMEELGKGLVVEPYLPTVVLFGGLITRAGNEAQRSSWIPSIFSGFEGVRRLYTLKEGGLIWSKNFFSLTSPLRPPCSPTRVALNMDLTAFRALKEA